MEVNINTPETEFHNIYEGPRGLEVRPGFVTQLRVEDIGVATPRSSAGTSTKIIFAFSAESANTGETFHYLFSQDSSNNLIASVYDSQFICRSSYTVGPMTADPEPFSVAINYNQIVVNSRSMPYPLWGFVGGSLVRANKVESINPDTPALTLFPGRVCSFADRFAWAYANQVIFNDPGTEPRTITAPNAISFGGTVLDLFQAGTGGALIVVCTDATYSIPPDGLNGYQFQGVVSRIPGYQGARSNNAATARGGTIGLIKDAIIDISTFRKRELVNNRINRYYSLPVGPDASGDFRNGSLLATDEGFIISINGKSCLLDLDSDKITWYYGTSSWTALTGGDITIIGVLKDTDGKNIFVTNTAVIDFFGNTDYATTPTVASPTPGFTEPQGSVLLKIPTDPQMSPVIREITTSADSVGQTQSSYIRGSRLDAQTPAPRDSFVIGTNNWDNTRTLVEREQRSRRMQRAVRMDTPAVELTFRRGGTRISDTFDVVTRGIGKNRPTQ